MEKPAKFILDSAAFINTDAFPFSEKGEYLMTSACEAEIKERMAKLRLETALQQHENFQIMDACPVSVLAAQQILKKHGDARLSEADESVLALAWERRDRGDKVCVYTDDYSLQNLLKWEKIPFQGIQQKGIQKARKFGKKRTST